MKKFIKRLLHYCRLLYFVELKIAVSLLYVCLCRNYGIGRKWIRKGEALEGSALSNMGN